MAVVWAFEITADVEGIALTAAIDAPVVVDDEDGKVLVVLWPLSLPMVLQVKVPWWRPFFPRCNALIVPGGPLP